MLKITKKKKENTKTATEEVVKLQETTGTKYPEGYDPTLPDNKQRQFR